MQIGIVGATGPAGSALGIRLASAGHEVILGSRSAERASEVVDAILAQWPDRNLKITASEAVPRLVHQALQVIGIAGYRNDSPYAVGRHFRDALSASLMVGNERILARNASLLLVHKDD